MENVKQFVDQPQQLEKTTVNSTKQILYYADLICEKIDLHVDAFIKRVEALKKGDMGAVEFVEEMILEPLEKQIGYLAKRASEIGKEEK